MTVTVRQLAELVRGKVFGDDSLAIRAARTLREAEPGDITFVEDDKHTRELHACRASAVIAPEGIAVNGRVLIQVADPLDAFATVVRQLHGRPEPPVHGIDPRACVDASAVIGPDASVYPLVVIGEGTVNGDLQAEKSVMVRETAKLRGNITAPNVSIVEGAHFNGGIDMEKKVAAADSASAAGANRAQKAAGGAK